MNIAPLGKCNLVDSVSAELPLFTLCEMLEFQKVIDQK